MQDYSGKQVVILGLGSYEHGSGLAAVRFFLRQGADLLITDLKTEEELSTQIKRVKDLAAELEYRGKLAWALGSHPEEEILSADLIVPNPAVPVTAQLIRRATEKGIPIKSEMALFFSACPAEIIGITGTRGKSTTTALIAHLLKAYPRRVLLGGNIGKGSPLDFLDDLKKDDRVVLELSNFMLEYLDLERRSPHVAVLLNVLPDHLNRYAGDIEAYAASKDVITKYQNEHDVFVANNNDERVRAIAGRTKARVVYFDAASEIDGYFLRGSKVVEKKEGKELELIDVTQVPLRGEHNYQNILAAVACVRQLESDPVPLQQQIGSFRSLEGRLQFIDELKGITFINDTTSTTPVSTLAALQSMQGRPIILLAGGSDKGLDFDELAGAICQVKAVIWLPGEGTDRLKQAMSVDAGVEQVDAQDMKDAVKQAFLLAEKGDAVLLSPGCASFGLFRNEFDRGSQFDQAVSDLKSMM